DEDLLLEAQEGRAQEGPAREIEKEDPLHLGEACRLALRHGGRQGAQVHERQGRPPGRVDPLHGPAPGRDEARAERLVALDLRGERRRERRRRHRAAERQRERHVVARVARPELVGHPPPLLPERQRRLGAAGAAKAAPLPRSRSTSAANAATVGLSKRTRSGSSTENAWSTREVTWAATSEWPPRAKKSSSTPTRCRSSTSSQIPASTSSTGLRGATYAPPSPRSTGAGRAARSTLPLAVSGSRSRSTQAAGTI